MHARYPPGIVKILWLREINPSSSEETTLKGLVHKGPVIRRCALGGYQSGNGNLRKILDGGV